MEGMMAWEEANLEEEDGAEQGALTSAPGQP